MRYEVYRSAINKDSGEKYPVVLYDETSEYPTYFNKDNEIFPNTYYYGDGFVFAQIFQVVEVTDSPLKIAFDGEKFDYKVPVGEYTEDIRRNLSDQCVYLQNHLYHTSQLQNLIALGLEDDVTGIIYDADYEKYRWENRIKPPKTNIHKDIGDKKALRLYYELLKPDIHYNRLPESYSGWYKEDEKVYFAWALDYSLSSYDRVIQNIWKTFLKLRRMVKQGKIVSYRIDVQPPVLFSDGWIRFIVDIGG